ncbi:bifunctional glutamate N-acetyltransferase/amino-acid acetyltransferase ArgJ [Actinomyces sp. 2119]|uniref:Arginine biosynthesis bifunctional protein ArgJ n=1 Tax=Actinomyces lilanjuaniae TaxID=2321394 RepID=A0ABM6Z2Y1_9ACTO|nr:MULTISPECIES: bifunctional glutamate N-acetyltransferase/amino-acid acetyltransferase ArgJ [Actinomyces]AYD89625.1 bifunctional glutamate N-acetyltransferase/amino-acid acetyltransferase ArgJ [Actinomyces lilanjuaniae]RJF40219.1 bifunctional glutamate N-acetyltransferase/amino-acid acetyltransferase ArgJ [Actinomyces sp. 2119]
MSVTAAQGFRAAGVAAGLKPSAAPDLALVVNDGPHDVAAGVFTTNRVVAAPVVWSRQALAPACGQEGGRARAVVLNSGSANACTGVQGVRDTEATAMHVAGLLGCDPAEVLVCSTGVIGEPLDMPRLLDGADVAALCLEATADAGTAAATAIMTTDTVSKEEALTVGSGPGRWTVGGMIKGVGMLAPAMATMLAVVTTDAVVTPDAARQALSAAAARTLNRISSDGCMSTNDTVVLLASGASGVPVSQEEFEDAVTELLARLGRRLVADAEGATHDIAVTVAGAVSEAAAEAAARTVAASTLLRCAVAGQDPNWGRVLAQLGTVPESVCPFDPDQVDVAINGVTVFRHGNVGEDRSHVDMTPRETRIDIDLHSGQAQATVWTNDLTHDYVSINADYTT